MSLKCSLFGHAFGEAAVDRERAEQGSEVVITVREVETCDRCGAQRVVSQNKEVRTRETGEESPAAAEGSGERDDAGAGGWSSPGTDLGGGGGGGDAVIDDDARDAEFLGENDEAEAEDVTATGDGAPEDAGDEVEDDGGHQETLGGADTVADVDGAGLSDPADEEPVADDDGVILEDDDGDDEREPGQWPEEHEADEPDWVAENEAGPDTDTSGASETTADDEPGTEAGADDTEAPASEPDPEPTTTAVSVAEGEFVCEECDFRTAVESSSLRAGDFCPECHTGTLVHHEA